MELHSIYFLEVNDTQGGNGATLFDIERMEKYANLCYNNNLKYEEDGIEFTLHRINIAGNYKGLVALLYRLIDSEYTKQHDIFCLEHFKPKLIKGKKTIINNNLNQSIVVQDFEIDPDKTLDLLASKLVDKIVKRTKK